MSCVVAQTSKVKYHLSLHNKYSEVMNIKTQHIMQYIELQQLSLSQDWGRNILDRGSPVLEHSV